MEFNIIIEKGEDGYLISEVVELPGCHTQGKTMKELEENIIDAYKMLLMEDVPIKHHEKALAI